MEENEEKEDLRKESFGRFGKAGHQLLIKKALLKLIERYDGQYGTIRIDRESIEMRAGMGSYSGISHFSSDGIKFIPDIMMEFYGEPDKYGEKKFQKKIIVECETTDKHLLKNKKKLVAYELLRLTQKDGIKLMIYLAMPKEFKGTIEKPESFNDIWFFDLNTPITGVS